MVRRSLPVATLLALSVTGLVSLTGCMHHQTDASLDNKSSISDGSANAAPAPANTSGSRDVAGYTTVSRAFPTGDRATSAVLLSKQIPTEVRAGQPFDYNVTVENLTDKPLQDVTLVDNLSPNLKINNSDVPAQAGPNGGTQFSFGSLAPHESKTFKVNATASGDQGTLQSCALVNYNSTLCSSIPVVNPKLALTLQAPAEQLVCEVIPVHVTVTNNGTGTARNVTVHETLPDGLLTEDGKNEVNLSAGDLRPGESKDATTNLKASKTGSFNLAPTATAEGQLTANATGAVNVQQPTLTLAAGQPSSDTVYVGRPVSYDVTVKNTSNVVAKNAILVNSLSSGDVELLNASDTNAKKSSDEPNKVRYDLGDLAPGASKTIAVKLMSAKQGAISNYLWAGAECAQPAQAQIQANVKGAPGILLGISDAIDPIPVGDTETYTIQATNQGDIAQTNVKVTANLEDSEQFISADGPTKGTANGGTVTFDAIPTLEPKQTATFIVKVKAVKAADARVKVTMTSDQLTRPVNQEESTNLY